MSCVYFVLAFILCQGFSMDLVKAASCPAPGIQINATDVCENITSNNVGSSSYFSYMTCDHLHNLSTWNSSLIRATFEFLLRKDVDLQLSVLKFFVRKVNGKELEEALEEFNDKVNASLIPSKWKGFALEALWNGKLRNEKRYNETEFVAPWFQKRLRPFLAAISTDILQCLQNETLGCAQYQAIVKGLDLEFKKMSQSTQKEVYYVFQLPYLKGLNATGSTCADGLNTSAAWLTVNFRNFSKHATYQDFLSLNSRFNGLEVLGHLTVKQHAQLSATHGSLRTPDDALRVMNFVTTSTVTEYIDELGRQFRLANMSLAGDIRATLLHRVLAAAQPMFQKAEDAEFMQWMDPRLADLISGLNSTHIPFVFEGLEARNCSVISAVVAVLNNSINHFSNTTQESIYRRILNVTAGSSLQCYAINTSFDMYLRETFQGFAAYLNLRDLASAIPASKIQKIVNTVDPAALADLLSSSGFLNDDNFLTVLVENYKRKGPFIDSFNKRRIVNALPSGTGMAILAGMWPVVLRSDNETALDMWLGARLWPYFSFIQGKILDFSGTQNASCTAFRKIVGKVSNNITAFQVSQQDIYNFTKAYLTATSARPRCYNASDPCTANWIAAYLGHSIHYSSADDVRSFLNDNTTVLQDLVINTDNLRLINRTGIPKDVAELYATALFAKNSNFSLVDLPAQLLCFARHSTAIRLFSTNASLSIIARVNLHCGPSNWSELKDTSTTDRQLATMLVAQITAFDVKTLAALGQQAVGLTAGQILELRAQDIADPLVLQLLGHVNDWDRGQSQGLMNKLISSNFMLETAEAFQRLGTLVPGLPSHIFSNITADMAMTLAKNADFHRAIKKAPSYIKGAFVHKIISNSSTLSDILNNVPDDLVNQVPLPLLAFRDKLLDLHKINEKQWSPDQAAVFFVAVLNATNNYADLSASVLQGLQCSAASRLLPSRISSLVEQVRNKKAALSTQQLSCLAKILAAKNMTANFTHYPPDILLFFDSAHVHNHTCKEFYHLASQGNLNLLPNGSAQRMQLRNNALVCLGGVNKTLSKEQLSSLGALVCDLDPAAVTDSDPQILENLKLCPDLAGAQQAALNALLSRGGSQYGAPLSWDLGSLQSLGVLTLYLNRTTWRSVSEGVRKAFFRSTVAGYQTQSAAQKEKTMFLLESIGAASPSSPKAKRATEQCQSESITASIIQDPLFIVHYDTKGQFDACLSNEVLEANLVPLLEHPLPEEYLDVMKRKLSEIYPAGIPEDQLKLLGQLSRLYDGNEISKWRVTSSDTLSALLDPSSGRWKASEAKQLITRYLDLGGTLTGPLLQRIGGRDLCGLDDNQINKINPEAIGDAGKLDISSCSQSKKDQLYAKAHQAFARHTGTGAYYPLIQPYLGGAPVKDLEDLAGSNIAMHIDTFTSLKPSELQNLSVQNVKNLLGVNLPDLKQAENHPSVTNWIQRHYQSELDNILGISLRGGMPGPISMAIASSVTSATPDISTSLPATTYGVTARNTTSPPATIIPLASIHNITTAHKTTFPPTTTYNVTTTHSTTSTPAIIIPFAITHNTTTSDNTTSPPATTYNVTATYNTTSLLATITPLASIHNFTVTHDTTSPRETTYNTTTTYSPTTTYNDTTTDHTTTDNTTSPPATTHYATSPPATMTQLATIHNTTTTHNTTSPSATTYDDATANITTTDKTTSPPVTTYNTTTSNTISPPATITLFATIRNTTTTHSTTSTPATTYDDTTTSLTVTTYNTTTSNTTSPPATITLLATIHSTTVTHNTTTPSAPVYNDTTTDHTTTDNTTSPPATTHYATSPPATMTQLATIHNTTTTHNTTSPSATTYDDATANITTTDKTTSPPVTTYNTTTSNTISPPATITLFATIRNTTTTHSTTSTPATTYDDTTTSLTVTTYNTTTSNTTSPPATITLLATIHSTTVTHNTTTPSAPVYNDTTTDHTTTDNTTSPPATTHYATSPPATRTQFATIRNTTTTHNTTSTPATTYNDTTTSLTVTTYNTTTSNTTSPPATITLLATIHSTTVTHNTTTPSAPVYNDTTTDYITTIDNTMSPPATITPLATIHNITTTHNNTSPPATAYNTSTTYEHTSAPAIVTPLATFHNTTTSYNTTSPTAITPVLTIHKTTATHNVTSMPATTHNITILPATIHSIITPAGITHITTTLPATIHSTTHNTTFITSPKKPVTPSPPKPNSTSPFPMIFTSTQKTVLTPAASTTTSTSNITLLSTATTPTSPAKTGVPPASATTLIPPKTATKKTATNTTWLPKPTPAGYIILEPATAAGAKQDFSFLHTLAATISIAFVRRFL